MHKKLRKAAEMSSIRKRKATLPEEESFAEEPKIKRINTDSQLTHKDKFCWVCHSDEETDEPWLSWQCCPRIYHAHCASDSSECPECMLDSEKHSKLVPRKKLNKLLLSVLGKYLDDEKRDKGFTFQPVFVRWPSHIETVHAVDFEYLINKTKNEEFSKTSEFLSDVKWILHNCHTSQSSATIKNASKKLVKLIKDDIEDIEACHECCDLEHQDFVKLCTPPHPIVWAQIYKFPSWPAKCLKVNEDKAYVKFFGTHDIGKLSVKNCHYISRSHPASDPATGKGTPRKAGYLDAVEELEEYVRLYGQTPFPYYQHRVPYTPHNLHKLEIPSTSEPPVINHHAIEELSYPLDGTEDLQANFASSTVEEEPMRSRGESFVNYVARFFGVNPKDSTAKDVATTIESAVSALWGIVKGLPSGQEILWRSHRQLQETEKALEGLTAQNAQLQEERHALIKRSEELIEGSKELEERLSNAHMLVKNLTKENQRIVRECKLLQELKEEARDFSQQTEDVVVESYDITVAKRNAYCYVCLKPANSVCCLSASYCSQECREKDASHHQPLCKQSLLLYKGAEQVEYTTKQSTIETTTMSVTTKCVVAKNQVSLQQLEEH